MKNNNRNNQPKNLNTRSDANKHRPETRDNLDNRISEEQEFKGDDITHNRKEHRKPEKGKPKH